MVIKRVKLPALISSLGGRFFSVGFWKKDGTYRNMCARVGVKQYRRTKGAISPAKKLNNPYIVVWDKVKKDYRMVNLETVDRIKCGRVYHIEE
jgi:hypothetical protein